jgi:hypothetical protein
MPAPKEIQMTAAAQRATGWAGVVLAVIAVLGLLYAPGLVLLWIVMLVFAVAAIPQALLAGRFTERRQRRGR